MSTNSQYSIASRNAALDARAVRLNGGYLRVYTGTQPATADTALSGNTLLAEHRFLTPAFGASSGAVATANTIANVSILATGTATWIRCLQSDGVTVECDGNIGTSAANMIVGSTAYQVGASSGVATLTITAPAQGS